MTAPQTEPLRRLLQGLQGLWGDKHGFALCCLEIVSTPVPDRAEAWAAIAPGGIGAGDGWYECADHVKPVRAGEPIVAPASPLLAAEISLSEGAGRSVYLRRQSGRLLRIDYTESTSSDEAGFEPRLVETQTQLATAPGCTLVYRLYWGWSAVGLRPLAARLAGVRLD